MSFGAGSWGWDRPFWATREEFARTGEAACLWEAHRVGMDLEYCHIEKLANLQCGVESRGRDLPVTAAGVEGGRSSVRTALEDPGARAVPACPH
jgi:hypothetical protein